MSSDGAPEVVAELREILARATGRAELLGLSEQTPLFGAGVGLDSLATLGTLAAYITEHLPAGPVSGG